MLFSNSPNIRPRSSSKLYELWQRMVPNTGYKLEELKELCHQAPELLEGTAHNLVHQGIKRKYISFNEPTKLYYRSDSENKETYLPAPSSEMEGEKIEEFADSLAQKLRHKAHRLKQAKTEREEVSERKKELAEIENKLTVEIEKIEEEFAQLRDFFRPHAA